MNKNIITSFLFFSSMILLADQADRSSILQTAIVPYIQSQDCDEQLESVNDELVLTQDQLSDTEQLLLTSESRLDSALTDLDTAESIIDQATDLINASAIPDASAIDFAVSALFGYTPTTIDSLITDPLVPRIQNGLLPYLQAALEKLGDYSKIVKVATGYDQLVVLTEAGKVYATGGNSRGQLGVGDRDNRYVLTPMLGAGECGVTAISAGQDHTLILKNGGIYGVGRADVLGIGIETGDAITTLTAVPEPGASGVIAVVASSNNSYFIKDDGSVWSTGDNGFGQLGIGGEYDDVYFLSTFTRMIGAGISGAVALAASDISEHLVVLKDDETVWVVGRNEEGQLGLGTLEDWRPTLTQMIGDYAEGVSKIAAGGYYTLVLKNGVVYATGDNSFGQLGDGTYDQKITLTAVIGEGTADVIAVTAGDNNTVVLKSNGAAYATGDNSSGQLGIDPLITLTATLVAMLGEGSANVIDIAAGSYFTSVVKNNNKAYGTGYNYDGELGTGSNSQKDILTQAVLNMVAPCPLS